MSEKHAIRKLEKMFICAPTKGILLNFSQLRVFTGSVGKANVLFHKGPEGLQSVIPRLGSEDAFFANLQFACSYENVITDHHLN